MEESQVRGWIGQLESRLDVGARKLTVGLLSEVRDQSVLLFERAFGADNALAKAMRDVVVVAPPAALGALSFLLPASPRSFRTRQDIVRLLRNARFSLDLERSPFDDGPACGLAPPATDRLVAMVRNLIVEVQDARLDASDREELLAALHTARTILEDTADPDTERSNLQRVLGHAVAKAGRGGSASGFWKRVAEVMMVAEAAVSLGLGVAAITQPDAVRVEVDCAMDVPALPPAPEPPQEPSPPPPPPPPA